MQQILQKASSVFSHPRRVPTILQDLLYCNCRPVRTQQAMQAEEVRLRLSEEDVQTAADLLELDKESPNDLAAIPGINR